jgi:hypothetical protein
MISSKVIPYTICEEGRDECNCFLTNPSVDWKISAAEYPSSKSVSLSSIFASTSAVLVVIFLLPFPSRKLKLKTENFNRVSLEDLEDGVWLALKSMVWQLQIAAEFRPTTWLTN